jgi:hypothetical protein
MDLDLGFRHLRSIALLTAIALLALYGCEKQFTPKDVSRMSERQLISYSGRLIDKIVSLRCVDPEVRSSMKETKRTLREIEYHHPRILKDLITSLEDYLQAYETMEAAGVSCDELKSGALSGSTD